MENKRGEQNRKGEGRGWDAFFKPTPGSANFSQKKIQL